MKARTWILLTVLACTGATDAVGGREEARKRIESSMLVTGVIEIDKDGSVGGHTLDEADKLPPLVRELVAKAIPVLRFKPIEAGGQAVEARARMGLRVVARQTDGDNYSLRIASASFGSAKAAKRYLPDGALTPPSYPPAAYRSKITGIVYLLLKIDAHGTVDDVATEQVNLTAFGTERQMARGRALLSKASESTARQWKFNPPAPDDMGDGGYLAMRVPVEFMLADQKPVGYGEWQAYVPGPRERRPEWLDANEASQSPDAMIAGALYPVGKGPKLVTPLTEG